MKPYTYEISVINPLMPDFPDTYSGEVTGATDADAVNRALSRHYPGTPPDSAVESNTTDNNIKDGCRLTFTDSETSKVWIVTVFIVRAGAGRIALDVLTCDGCGVCCTYCGCPPGYLIRDWRPVNLPDELHDELDKLDERARAGEVIDGKPCIWWDKETKKCSHYDFRPQVCRDFEPGGIDCQRVRMRLLGHN